MTTTALIDTQDALFDLVNGLPSVGDWKVDLGFPAKGVQRRHVWVSEVVTDHTQEYAVSSLTAKDERFDLTVYFYAASRDDQYIHPRDKLRVLLDEFLDAINVDWSLGGAVMLAEASQIGWEGGPGGDGREVMATVTVTCRTWLD